MSFSEIREVLFATDFSLASSSAGQTAAALAGRLGARLHVLHVVESGGTAAAFGQLDGLTDELRGRPSLSVVRAVETGAPAPQIVAYAGRNAIDLIVMGTHGRTGARHLIRGSVAEAVVRTAPCHVLAVKPVQSPPAVATVGAMGAHSQALSPLRRPDRRGDLRALFEAGHRRSPRAKLRELRTGA